ncbi:hypothetical protein PspLS_03031 [Pyricularia sp. CBS 133598]|nr:hypothetical protein PspLS_03031 [Pyricularia sp. CBS 133598]
MGSPTGEQVLVTTWLLVSIITIMISARLYLRLKIKRLSLQATDIFICISYIMCLLNTSADMVVYSSGAMKPDVTLSMSNLDVPLSTFERLAKTSYFSNFPFYTTFYTTKLALLTFYLDLFPLFLTKLRAAVWLTIAYCIASLVVVISLVLFLCFPIPRNWTLDRREMCSPRQQRITFYVNFALHLSGEVVIFALPFLMLRHVRLKTEVKVGVYATFAAGLATIGFGITRAVLILKPPGISGQGNARSLTQVMLYSTLDIHMGLVVACMPSLRPYLAIFSRKIASMRSKTGPSHFNESGSGGSNIKPHHLPGLDNFDPYGHLDAPRPPPDATMKRTSNNSETTVEVWDGRSMAKGQESDIELVRTNWRR